MLRGRRGLRLGIAAIAALVVLLAPSAASAQGITVTPNRFDDPAPGPVGCPTNCSLRFAVALGNANTPVTINLQPGTYTLTQPEPLTLVDTKTINGAGARATVIQGNGTDRVFFLQETTNATINDVTITGGTASAASQEFEGGGIYVQSPSTLNLNRSAVVGNSAANQGGGIFTESGNLVQIVDSTISGNVVGVGGGGGGIAGAEFSDLKLFNTTISGNQTGERGFGAGLFTLGELGLTHVTIAGNTSTNSSLQVSNTSNPTIPPFAAWNTIVTSDTGPACNLSRANAGANNVADDATCTFTLANPLLGPLQNNGGPTNTQALGAGSPAIDTADGSHCRPADQRGTPRPQLAACDIGAFEYVPPPPGGQQPPPDDDQLPPPRAGKSVNVLPKSGTVRIKLPGRKRFRALTEGEQIPVGTTVDTLKGRVTIIAAGGQTADFYGGIFKISQTKAARPLTTLKLVEKLSCAKAGKATIAAKRKKKRRLWGDGKGRFRTDGSYSSATVRGTKWLVEDRCKSTLTRVVRGRVAVRDKVKKKTVIVRRGKRYVAKARS